MISRVYPLNSLNAYQYVIIISHMDGRLLLSRHKLRDTWETQGGHIEEGETPLEAAKRELYEESGATEYEIEPLFDYYAEDEISGANGMVFAADIKLLGSMPESEMAETRLFDKLPDNLTYPDITPIVMAEYARMAALKAK